MCIPTFLQQSQLYISQPYKAVDSLKAWGGYNNSDETGMVSMVLKRIRRGVRSRLLLNLLLLGVFFLSCSPVGSQATPKAETVTVPPPTVTVPPPTSTSTTTPKPTMTTTPVHLQGCVEAHSLRVRAGPGTDHKMIGGLKAGECVIVLGRNEDATWGKITAGDLKGWVSLDYLSLEGDIQAVALVTGEGGQEAALDGIPAQSAAPQSIPLTPTAIPGSFHIHVPRQGSGSTVKSFNFEYACSQVTLDLPLTRAHVSYYTSLDKAFYYSGELPGDWEEQYYKKFLEGKYDDPVIASTVEQVREGLEIEHGDNLVLALTSLVQHIEYDCNKLFSYENLEDHDYRTSYPLETLFNQKGVCGDFSILLGKMLQEVGYGAAFLLYGEANHMAVGIRCPVADATYIYEGMGYCYIETTGPSRMGVKPSKINGEVFSEYPQIIPIAEGHSFRMMTSLAEIMETEAELYGDYVLQLARCEEISQYKSIQSQEWELAGYESELNRLSGRLETLADQLDSEIDQYKSMGCEGELPEEKYQQCTTKLNEIEDVRRTYNDLVRKYNRLYGEYERHYQGYVGDFQAFQDLMEENDQSCSTVSWEDLAAPEGVEDQDG